MGYADYDVNVTVPQGWPARRGNRRADESERRCCRDRLASGSPRRARSDDVVHVVRDRSAAWADEGENCGIRRRAHVAVPRAQRPRLRLGHIGKVSVGRDGGRGRDRDGDIAPDTTRHQHVLSSRGAHGRGTLDANTIGIRGRVPVRPICGRIRMAADDRDRGAGVVHRHGVSRCSPASADRAIR